MLWYYLIYGVVLFNLLWYYFNLFLIILILIHHNLNILCHRTELEHISMINQNQIISLLRLRN